MAIRTQDLLLPYNPVRPVNFGIADIIQKRQELEQMRADLEERKRRNKEDERLRELAEQGEMARAQLRIQQQRETDAAAAARALQADRVAALGKVDDRAAKWADTVSRDPWLDETVAILADMIAK